MADMGAAGFDPTDGGLNVHMKNSSGGAATIADGADVAEGATTNTAVTGDNTGTISAKLRGLNKLFADVWDNVNHWLQVKVMNSVALGQAPKISSIPVVLPSDQTSVASPLTVEQSIISAQRQGLAFVVATNTLTSSTTAYQALSLFNPANSGKTIYVYRILGWYAVTITHPAFLLYQESTDPSAGWTSPVTLTPINLNMASAATSVAVVKRTNSAQANALAGTFLYNQDVGSNVTTELLGPSGMPGVPIPPGSGFTVFMNTLNTSQVEAAIFYFEN